MIGLDQSHGGPSVFQAPGVSIAQLTPEIAAIVAAAAELAIVIDLQGRVMDAAILSPDLRRDLEDASLWIGRRWQEIATAGSRSEIEALLGELAGGAGAGARQISHQAADGSDLPLHFSALRLGSSDVFIAFGRDQRPAAALRQRLVDAQMALERSHAKLRAASTRARLLFSGAPDAVMLVDAGSHRIIEANAAAVALLEHGSRRWHSRPLGELFALAHRGAVRSFLGDARGCNPVAAIEVELADPPTTVALSASHLRHESAPLLLVRLSAVSPAGGAAERAEAVTDSLPDGFVVTDAAGRILRANPAFAAMVQAPGGTVLGTGIGRLFGRQGVDLDVLLANLRQHGAVRLFASSLSAGDGTVLDVEISAVSVGQGKATHYVFLIRDVDRRIATHLPGPWRSQGAGDLSDLIGRVPLKDITRDATDVIEKHCIEAALALTDDNRAAAAEMLGLSRQSLYVKLRRYGLMSPGGSDVEET